MPASNTRIVTPDRDVRMKLALDELLAEFSPMTQRKVGLAIGRALVLGRERDAIVGEHDELQATWETHEGLLSDEADELVRRLCSLERRWERVDQRLDGRMA